MSTQPVRTKLSAVALAICGQHYGDYGKKNGCGSCPIYAACTAPMEWSDAGFDRHTRNVNQAAATVGAAS